MYYTTEVQTSHYTAPPIYYAPSTSAEAVIGPTPNPNPNPSFDQVQVPIPVSVPQGIGASLTSPVGYPVSQYQDATYASYYPSMSAGGVGLAAAYLSSIPTVGPINPVKKKKVNCIATTEDLEAKKQKLIETGVDANLVRTCTICNVVCNSDKVFASHIASAKHISRVNGRPSKGLAQMLMSQQAVYSTPTKKLKYKKKNVQSAVQAPKVAQSVYCDICKVTCNTQEMYNNHVAGQKHNKKIKNITTGNKLIEFVSARSTSPGTKTSGVIDNDKKIIYCDICKAICNSQEMYNNHVSGKNHNEKIKNLTTVDSKNASKEYLEMKMKKVLESGGKGDAVKVCELCNVVCSSLTVFELHCSGQKHRNMVKKQEENFGGLAVAPTVAASTNNNDQEHMLASPLLKPEPKRKSKSASKEDLEMKKRKVLESGAKGDAVMVCDLCNVVCNGPMVFESHCRGQKHRSMVKKQKENFGGVAVTPAVVSAVMAAATS